MLASRAAAEKRAEVDGHGHWQDSEVGEIDTTQVTSRNYRGTVTAVLVTVRLIEVLIEEVH